MNTIEKKLKVLLVDECGQGIQERIKEKYPDCEIDMHYSSRETAATINPEEYAVAIIDLKAHLENLNNEKSIARYLKENNPNIINILKGFQLNLLDKFNCKGDYDLELNFLNSNKETFSKIYQILNKIKEKK